MYKKYINVKYAFLLFIFLFFSVTPLISAFFATFVVTSPPASLSLASLESTTVPMSVSISPSFLPDFQYTEGGAGYKLGRHWFCESEDDDGNCIDQTLDLCPYLSISPYNDEDTEVGFSQNASDSNLGAKGEINSAEDLADSWNITVKSPCFEGECPSDYDSQINGEPLPQNLKGRTFKCDISVDSSDHIVLVKQLLGGNIAYALTGPNIQNISAVFTGVYTPKDVGGSSVLFIPGLEASRLYKDGVLFENQLWEPNVNSDVEDLYLDLNGISKNNGIYTRDIIKETNTPISTGLAGQNIYKSFSDMMDDLVHRGEIYSWEKYPYDWRQGVQDIVENGTRLESATSTLTEKIQSLVETSKNGKVTIVAHSNGGLIAKALLKKLQDDKNSGTNNLIDKIDILILVAVPQIGTAKAVPSILHGYDTQMGLGWLMDEVRARQLGRNMKSAYSLLPSREYINHVNVSPATFVDDPTHPLLTTTTFVNSYGSALSSYEEYKDFLLGSEGRIDPSDNQINLPIKLSSNLFSQAENLHDVIDKWTPPSSMRVIEVAGWGLDTVASYEYYPKYVGCQTTGPVNACSSSYVVDVRPRFTRDGDKTVVAPSAQYMNSNSNIKKYWVDFKNYNSLLRINRDHKDILEVDSLNNLISSAIKYESIILDSILKDVQPLDNGNLVRLSVHSPVTLDAYDSQGNHTGKVCPTTSDFCYLDENIINSSYMEFGEGKYINLPESELSEVRLQGTDIGTFTYESEKVMSDGTAVLSKFVDIPVTTQTQARVILNGAGVPELKLDVNGDGMPDFSLTPNNTFDPITYLKIVKVTVESLDINKSKKNEFSKRIDAIVKSIQKGKINKAKLRVDKFVSILEKKLTKKEGKNSKPMKLSKSDAQLLLDMLNRLLDNLE
ncbi:MAG: hypothetical protein ABL917_02975 [Parcubacteria group bacterium]